MAKSRFNGLDSGQPYRRAVAVTPSDSTVLEPTDAIHVGTAGNVTFTMANGTDATFTGLTAGLHRLAVTKVKSTSLTASNFMALYQND